MHLHYVTQEYIYIYIYIYMYIDQTCDRTIMGMALWAMQNYVHNLVQSHELQTAIKLMSLEMN